MGSGDTGRPGARRGRRIAVAIAIVALGAVVVSLFLADPAGCSQTARRNAAGVTYASERNCGPVAWPSVVAVVGTLTGATALVLWAAGRRKRGEEASDEAPMFPTGPW